MKTIREPLLDQNWIDFGTGRFNKEAFERQNKGFDKMYEKTKEKAKKRAEDKNNERQLLEKLYNWAW